MYSEHQKIKVGNCTECGAPAWWDEDDERMIFVDGDPDCLHYIEGVEDERHIKKLSTF